MNRQNWERLQKRGHDFQVGGMLISVVVPIIIFISCAQWIFKENQVDEKLSVDLKIGLVVCVAILACIAIGRLLHSSGKRTEMKAWLTRAKELESIYQFDGAALTIRGLQVLGAIYFGKYCKRIGLQHAWFRSYRDYMASLGVELDFEKWRQFGQAFDLSNCPLMNGSELPPNELVLGIHHLQTVCQAAAGIGMSGYKYNVSYPKSLESFVFIYDTATEAGVAHIDTRAFECFVPKGSDWGKTVSSETLSELLSKHA